MRPAGTPLPPIPPAARWAGRTVAWVAWAGMLALEAPPGMAPFPVSPAGLALLTVAIALDTHRWLPSQNTVASAILVALGGGVVTAALGSASRPALALSALLGFSHILCARGLVRLLLRSRRGRPGYGVAVLTGTTALASLSLVMSLALAGMAPRPERLLALVPGVAVAVVGGSVWWLVKKPVPETPNPWPALAWIVLTGAQTAGLASAGHPMAAPLAGTLLLAAPAAWRLARRTGPADG